MNRIVNFFENSALAALAALSALCVCLGLIFGMAVPERRKATSAVCAFISACLSSVLLLMRFLRSLGKQNV